jgi:hypothetical protein
MLSGGFVIFEIVNQNKVTRNMNIRSLKFLVLVGTSCLLMSNRGGSPGTRSGSPSDGSTCSTVGGCHASGNAPESQDFISSDIPSSGYVPDRVYTITLSPSQNRTDVWGFEMSTEGDNGESIGDFSNSTDANLIANKNRVTHI